MKNFVIKKVVGRKVPFVLVSNDPPTSEYKPFTEYVYWLEHVKGATRSTVETYSGHVARFIDFVFESSKHNFGISEVEELIALYQTFLLYPHTTSDVRVIKLCNILGKNKPTAASSISETIEIAIRYFIIFSIDRSNLLDEKNVFSNYAIPSFTERSSGELSSIKSKDWLSSTIRGNLERVVLRKGKIFSISKQRAKADKDKKKLKESDFYAIEKVEDLLSLSPEQKNPGFHRDMAIYSFLAASGCRTHECLQIRISDINFDKREVELVNPFSRENPSLTEEENAALKWKGRNTRLTLLLAPFDLYFWEHLRYYICDSFQSNVSHDFLFQKSNGRPFFTTHTSDRNKRFKKYAHKSSYKDFDAGLHSLRHMYGRYTLNYFPTENGFGLPLAYVKILMGHSSISSTEIYAIHDEDLLTAYIELANRRVHADKISFNDIRLAYLGREIDRLEKEQKGLSDNV